MTTSAVFLGCAFSAASLWGQESPQAKAESLRKEIAGLQTAMDVLAKRINAAQQELAAIELNAPAAAKPRVARPLPTGLQFPVDIERAMLGQAAPTTRQLSTPPQRIIGPATVAPPPKK